MHILQKNTVKSHNNCYYFASFHKFYVISITNHNEALDKLEVLLQQETEDCEKAKTSLKDLMTKLETLKPDADQKPILEEEISKLKDELKKTSDKVKELTNSNEAQSGKVRLLLSNYQKLSKVKDETDGQVNDLIKQKEKLQKEFEDFKEMHILQKNTVKSHNNCYYFASFHKFYVKSTQPKVSQINFLDSNSARLSFSHI